VTIGGFRGRIMAMPAPPPLFEDGPLRLRRCREGAMLYYATDEYVGRALDLYGEAHGLELDFLGRIVRPGQTVLDVGANIGDHALAFARMTGPTGLVWAIEPQPGAFRLLCANLALNRVGHVMTLQAAAGAAPGRTRVPVLDYAKPGNYGGVAAGGDWGVEVPVVAIDALGLAACHLLKLDVEGMENEALAGAARTIARCRPLLYVENDREERSRELIERMGALGYRLWWHTPPLFNPGNHFGNGENVYADVGSINMLGVPAERKTEVRNLRPVAGPHETWRDALGLSR
jgi:FkbM family methyltransferase